jgi:acid phosphatase type 7
MLFILFWLLQYFFLLGGEYNMQSQNPSGSGGQSAGAGGVQSSGSSTLNTLAPRNFSNPLASTPGVQVSVDHGVHPNLGYENLPPPTGAPPYHLTLDEVLPDQIAAIQAAGKMVFHTVGDSGGIKTPQFQQEVANQMVADFQVADASSRPVFFYHIGDVVYYAGEDSEYYNQFYEPYQLYSAPIFAIPGNHDGEVANTTQQSLAGFVTNFCAQTPVITADAGDTHRHAMTQPNVYWTFEAPFVTFIGLYTNVPEGGKMDDAQIAWFASEMANAPKDKALIVAAHHPCYSADNFHSGSKYMVQQLEQAMQSSGRTPDAVLAGHVHNYQRFTRTINGKDVPFIVAGAGGYYNLHTMQKAADGSALQTPFQFTDLGVTLESYCADHHGYLLMEVSAQTISGQYFAVPGPKDAQGTPAKCVDTFSVNITRP